MSDFETDPQRRPVTADREHSHPTAELPRDDRGQSDAGASTADPAAPAATPAGSGDPTASFAATGTSDGSPTGERAEPSTAAAPSVERYNAGGYPATGQTAEQPYSGVPASGQPYAGAPAPGQPYGGAPASGHSYGGNPYAAAPASGQPYGAGSYGTAPASGQPYSLPPTGRPGDAPAQAGASPWQAPTGGQHHSPWAPGHPGAPQPPQHGGPVPPWATPGTPAPGRSGPGRIGRAVAVGVAALALMVGSGLAGGAIATALDDGPTVTNRTYSAAPVINAADLPKIAAQVQDSVVSISTGSTEGSGVVISADGFVLTNNHVVASASGGGTVKVFFADGKTADADVIGTDPKTDLAVVKAEGVSGLAVAKLGDSDAMQVGDQVLALGSPLGLQGSVTAGIISARDRTIRAGGEGEQQNPFEQPQQGAVSSISGLLQTDAPINPGNSGGALVNTKAEVIGINTAILTAGQGSGNIGVGFAIPSNKAKAVAEALQRGEKVSHPSLGVQVTPAENGGALVSGVVPNSPAAKAGLQQGDVVTQFGDRKIGDADDLVGAVQAGKVGDQVQVTYTRNGVEKTATVTLAETS
ncbi:peptidase S1 [Plantactinospora sp. BC1]|uniref:S1C family serine protease n=1 Tax=Plantactinospora sp. BC1 TaxID=2108470 RepID=UPI000D161335|nr:trypsin-like peptidase domain-containing protein [Plantactinospora sp. BC1]AVT30464.1 peptidase S1 [Plantactinospora sp. BC1]